jgi:hypothetical protein
VLVWRGNEDVTRLGFTDPLEALLIAITYLRKRYSVRLTNAACDELDALAPELERMLSPETSIRAARATAGKAAVRRAAEPRGGVGAVPAAERLRVPAVMFSPPGDVPVALD